MSDEIYDDSPQAEDPIQSASPGGPCDICVSCGACNPENMSQFTVNPDKLPANMGDGAKTFVENNMHIFKAIPEGNVHNVQIGNMLVSGFKTSEGELRLNMTDKFSPEKVLMQGSDYLNPDYVPAPKILRIEDAKFNPEMRARLIQQRNDAIKAATQPDAKQVSPNHVSNTTEQPKPIPAAMSPRPSEEKRAPSTSQPEIGSKKNTYHETQQVGNTPVSRREEPVIHTAKNIEPTQRLSDHQEAGTVTHTRDQKEKSLGNKVVESHTTERTTPPSPAAETVSSKSKIQDSVIKIDAHPSHEDKQPSAIDLGLTPTVTRENPPDDLIPPVEKLSISTDLPAAREKTEPEDTTINSSISEKQTITLQQDNPIEVKIDASKKQVTKDEEPKPTMDGMQPDVSRLVETHTKAIHALFDFMTIITPFIEATSTEKRQRVAALTPTETQSDIQTKNSELHVMEFPDHSSAVVKQFLIGADAKSTDMSGVMEIIPDTKKHEPKSIREEIFVIEDKGHVYEIKVIEEEDKPVKIVAPKAAIQLLKDRLQRYLKQAGVQENPIELVAEEENQGNLVSLSLGYTDDTILFWLSYLQMKAAFFSSPWDSEKTLMFA